MLRGARRPAERLAALTVRTDPQLNAAAAAEPQSPDFLGGHGDAEDEHFLDSTDATGDTALDGALCTRQRCQQGLGGNPGLCTFSATLRYPSTTANGNFATAAPDAGLRRPPAVSARFTRFQD